MKFKLLYNKHSDTIRKVNKHSTARYPNAIVLETTDCCTLHIDCDDITTVSVPVGATTYSLAIKYYGYLTNGGIDNQTIEDLVTYIEIIFIALSLASAVTLETTEDEHIITFVDLKCNNHFEFILTPDE